MHLLSVFIKLHGFIITLCIFSGKTLNNQLSEWLQAAASPTSPGAKAIISPHAGYSYCGACAAHAYKQIIPDNM